jgi:predicted LPLAT superfamily acyltransferase
VYRLFINQGRNLIDRHYLVERLGPMEMDIVGFEPLRELVAAGRGMILLTAHLGNWQVVMSALRTLGRPVHLLMRPEDNPAVQANLRVSQANDAIRLISPEGFLGGVVEVMAVLRQGGIVSIMGDRTYGFEAVDVEFLGAPARFPRGAFTIAAAVECPVVVLLSAKVGALRYRMEVAGIIEPRYREEGDKRTQVRGWVQAFARLLEDHIRRYPYQCFLFHDVWAEAAECAEAGPATAGRRRR